MKIYSFYSNQPHIPHDLLWCFHLMSHRQADATVQRRQTSLTRGFIHRSLISATDWQAAEGAATLKQNQFSPCLVKGGRCLRDSGTKRSARPLSQEKRSFRFINSRLKRNYLPTDLNHQQKDNRTKSGFLLRSLKFFVLMLLFFFLSPRRFRWVNRIMQRNHGGWKWSLIFEYCRVQRVRDYKTDSFYLSVPTLTFFYQLFGLLTSGVEANVHSPRRLGWEMTKMLGIKIRLNIKTPLWKCV